MGRKTEMKNGLNNENQFEPAPRWTSEHLVCVAVAALPATYILLLKRPHNLEHPRCDPALATSIQIAKSMTRPDPEKRPPLYFPGCRWSRGRDRVSQIVAQQTFTRRARTRGGGLFLVGTLIFALLLSCL